MSPVFAGLAILLPSLSVWFSPMLKIRAPLLSNLIFSFALDLENGSIGLSYVLRKFLTVVELFLSFDTSPFTVSKRSIARACVFILAKLWILALRQSDNMFDNSALKTWPLYGFDLMDGCPRH